MTVAELASSSAPPTSIDASASMRAVAKDIAAMKKIAIPIVAELGQHLRTRGELPPEELVAALTAQLDDEHRHAALCAAFARQDPGSPAAPPAHAGAFARVVHELSVGPARPYLLCVATAVCTAVETVAFRHLAAATREPAGAAMFETLAHDEERHLHLVIGAAADRLDQLGVPRARARALRLVLALARVTLGAWWPGQLAAYRGVGLRVPSFVRALGHELARALRRLGVFFPRRMFVFGATAWLTVCAWRRAGKQE